MCCAARWQKVENIVAPGAKGAKIPVTVVLVANHAVQRVHRFVQKAQRRAAQQGIKQRGYHPVAGVFRHCFHRRLDNAGFIQRLGIAPYNARNRLARKGDVLGFQRPVYQHALIL